MCFMLYLFLVAFRQNLFFIFLIVIDCRLFLYSFFIFKFDFLNITVSIISFY